MLLALIFLLIFLYLVIAADMYLPYSIKKDDVMTNLQPLNSARPLGATRNDLILTQSGEKISVSADTAIVFRQNVPISIYYTPILHKPRSVDFAQNETIQHINTLYLSRSYNIYFALFFLSIAQIICLLRWSKGKKSSEIFLYASVFLFAFLLAFQYFR